MTPLLDSTEATQLAGRYTVLERIGSGGVAIVYRARDEVTGRVVAFKQLVLANAGKRAKALEALFEREYHTLVRVKHPRIIEVYDYGVTPQGPYYTMELLEGSDLGQLQRLPYTDVCRHLRDVASSLALLHAQRLVHRDVSPRNIRLTADGTARLLDFGALASFGTNAEIIGTPAFMAPEILHQWPLDPRTDLYSLGAVGYYCLTGRPAFAARDVNELPQLWQSPPIPPSELADGVPPELERLILSMLSRDPLGRPETAAAVIDRLTAIADLPPEPHERAEQSYFLSSPMVGRHAQIDWVLRRIEHALSGKGGEALVEGPTGIGKTRLANELCLAATLKGVVTLRADAESTRESFGVAIALGRRLLETCPDVARRAIEPHVATLRKLAPELIDAVGDSAPGPIMNDPAEQRLRLHTALREWFFAVARERTLLVCVDDVQSLDDDSASLLLTLGRESRSLHLFVLSTFRSGSSAAAPEAIRILRQRVQRLRLPSLDAQACEQLAGGLFGGAANAGRVGSLLWQRSGGVPRQFVELAQLMVQKKIAKYEAGSWVLPLDVADDELPARSEEILTARLSELGPGAVALAGNLAVHSGAMPLATVLASSELSDDGRTHAALDELLAEQILVREGDDYRFRHDALREAVLSRMPPERRRRSRLRAAEALLASDAKGVAQRVEAALHLIELGEERRGAKILITAAREFSAGAGTHQNPDQLVRALCRLVRTYDEQGRSDYELGALLFPLMPLCYYSGNWQFMLEYGERAIDIGVRITGLRRAAELEPELGREEALKAGLAAGAAGFAEHAADVGYDLKTALAATIGMVPACVAVYTTCFDSEAIARIVDAITPLTLFGEQHVAYPMYLFAAAEVKILGSESESHDIWERALARFEDPAFARAVGEARTRALQGGVMFMLRLLDCYHFGERACAEASHMENLGVKAWAVTADQVRGLYHSLRGEAAEAKVFMERVERNVVQGAQTWQADFFWPALLLTADVLTGDAIAARRRYVQLERRSKEVATLKPQADAAHAAYLMLRGDHSGAISLYERLMPAFPHRKRVNWETTRAYFARALNAAGAHERAKAVAEEVVSNMIPSDEAFVVRFLEARRQLAIAESGLGNHERAASMLDELLARHGRESNPLLVGLLHQARAEVAERARDYAAAQAHRGEMESRFRGTKNPLLIAQCHRANRSSATLTAVRAPERRELTANTVSAFRTSPFVGPTAAADHGQASSSDGLASVDEMLSRSDEPFETGLELVLRHTRSKNAFLYVLKAGNLRLAWSSTNEEPPEPAVVELGRWLQVVRDGPCPQMTVTTSGVRVSSAASISGYRLVALQSGIENATVGGVILEAESNVDLVGVTHVFDALGRVIQERGFDALDFITV